MYYKLIIKVMNNIFIFSSKATLKCFGLALTFLLFNVPLSLSQEPKKNDNETKLENEWWIPILLKHNVNMMGSNTFNNIFEMGETNSVNNGICTLTNAFVILKEKSGNYIVIESPLITHDFNKELIITNSGTMTVYKKDTYPNEPVAIIQIQKMELKFPRN
jgi:hypothetical protein